MIINSTIFRILLGCFALWGALFYPTIESTVSIWNRSETFAHCFIILPICLYLIRQRWAELNSAVIKPNFLVLVPLLGVLAIWLFGSLAQLLVVEQGAAFLILPLMIWAVAGDKAARVMMFMLAFWMFSVPVGEFLIPQLQELTADITVWAIQMTGIPVYREGLYIAIPGGLFEVAVACSGIRYLIASFTLGTLFAYLNYTSTKKRIIFVLFSIALPLAANGVRAYGIVMIAHLSDMKYATGVDHLIYGWLFFGVVILIMFAIGGIWADPLPKEDKDNTPQAHRAEAKVYLPGFAAVAAVIVAGLTYKNLMQNPQSDFVPALNNLVQLQRAVNDDSWFPIYDSATLQESGNADGVDYYMAYYAQNVQGQELISSSNKLFNFKQWSIVSSATHGHYNTVQITNNRGTQRVLAYTFVTQWTVSPKGLQVKLDQAVQAFLGQAPIGMMVMMSKPIKPNEDLNDGFHQAASALFNPQLKEQLNVD